MNIGNLKRKVKILIAVIVYYLKGKKASFASWVKVELTKPEPTIEHPVCQLVTVNQFKSPIYKKWCDEMNEKPKLHRKQWEFVFTLQVLDQRNKIKPGCKGLGFGVGTEPLPAVFAKYGCEVLATDQDILNAEAQGWTKSNQHSSQVDMLKHNGIIGYNDFCKLVSFQAADMLAIPKEFENKYDFVWSCCSFEHLGNIEKGIDFVINSLSCLKKGGVAVHTTEFNLSSDRRTIESGTTVLYRRNDIEKLVRRIEEKGYVVSELNFNPGNEKLDQYIDVPPYKHLPHLKFLYMYISTSIGLIIERK